MLPPGEPLTTSSWMASSTAMCTSYAPPADPELTGLYFRPHRSIPASGKRLPPSTVLPTKYPYRFMTWCVCIENTCIPNHKIWIDMYIKVFLSCICIKMSIKCHFYNKLYIFYMYFDRISLKHSWLMHTLFWTVSYTNSASSKHI